MLALDRARVLLALTLALLGSPALVSAFSCPAGFYKHSSGKGCYPCGTHALTCKGKSLALTCASGYAVKKGICVGSSAGGSGSGGSGASSNPGGTVVATATATATVRKVVTVTAGFAPTVVATVLSTIVKAGSTVIRTTTSTSTQAGRTTTVSATTTLFTTLSSTTTSTKTTTKLSTTTPLTTQTVQASASALNTMLNAKFLYGGCYASSDLSTITTASSGSVDAPSPYTVSTTIAECYAQLAAFGDAHSSVYPVQCLVNGDQYRMITTSHAMSYISDLGPDLCETVCSIDPAVVALYGTEWCGGQDSDDTYWSVYELTDDL